MIENFDSRALRRTDCFAQRFMKPGVYRYNVLPVHSHCMTPERPFSIEVRERSSKDRMTQHNIAISGSAGLLKVDKENLSIEAGDLVLWNSVSSNTLPYNVAGDKEFFASHRMMNECGYSHAFGVVGEYPWSDAYGSGLDGVVRVKDPGCQNCADVERWQKQLTKGTIVMIDGGKAQPREVEILTGQTVFFAVIKAEGISITDSRLIALK
jgi:plastocyanin